MSLRSRLTAVGAVCALIGAAAPAHAVTYAFSTISAPTTPAGDVALALAINDNGQALVEAQKPGVTFGFNEIDDVYNIFTRVYTPIPQYPPSQYPGSTPMSTVATGINNAGVIVGFFHPPGGYYQGFRLTGSTFTGINAPSANRFVPAPFNTADAINNLGQIAGSYGDVNTTAGYLYSGGAGGVFTRIVAAPSPTYSTGATGLNDSGVIVGNFGLSATQQYDTGFVDVAGVITPISLPGFAVTQVNGINDRGMIVGGSSNDGFATGPGFIYKGGMFTLINYPGAVDTFVYGINSFGDLVGEYTLRDGTVNAFLAVPGIGFGGDVGGGAPEPATWAMMLIGMAGLGLIARRRVEKVRRSAI